MTYHALPVNFHRLISIDAKLISFSVLISAIKPKAVLSNYGFQSQLRSPTLQMKILLKIRGCEQTIGVKYWIGYRHLNYSNDLLQRKKKKSSLKDMHTSCCCCLFLYKLFVELVQTGY